MTENKKDYTSEEKEINILDYFSILLKRRKIIIINFIIFAFVSVVISLIMPKTYKAASIIMPSGTTGGGLLSGMSLNLPGGAFSSLFGGASEETNSLLAIIKSRTIAENTIKKFNLIERYNTANMEDALKAFTNYLYTSYEEEGTIEVEFEVSTGFFHFDQEEEEARKLCAEITNFLVSELDRLNTMLQTKQAKSYRIFIEKRYEENKKEIEKIENEIKEFSEKSGMISLPDQLSAAITAAAEFESQIAIKEVEFEVLKKILNKDNPQIKKIGTELQELHNKLNEMKLGGSEKDLLPIFPAFAKAPALGIKYIRLQRENEVQNLIYQFLTQQYEQAKLQEAKDTPSIQIIDEAVPPIRKSKPVRSLIVIISSLVGIFIGIFLAFFKEYFYRLSITDPERYQYIMALISGIRKDFLGRKVDK
jgi:capsule polysaccharide export protein KpsE/RkpR